MKEAEKKANELYPDPYIRCVATRFATELKDSITLRRRAFIEGAKWQAQREWVSAETPPQNGAIVQVYFKDIADDNKLFPAIAMFHNISRHSGDNPRIDDRWFVYPSRGYQITNKVVCWMPLPQPPKTKNK